MPILRTVTQAWNLHFFGIHRSMPGGYCISSTPEGGWITAHSPKLEPEAEIIAKESCGSALELAAPWPVLRFA